MKLNNLKEFPVAHLATIATRFSLLVLSWGGVGV
jgi:hypothetical protein